MQINYSEANDISKLKMMKKTVQSAFHTRITVSFSNLKIQSFIMNVLIKVLRIKKGFPAPPLPFPHRPYAAT